MNIIIVEIVIHINKKFYIFNLFFIVFIVILQIISASKRNFIIINGNKKECKIENKDVGVTDNLREKIRELMLITNNDENEYKELQNCLINDPDNEHCIYHLILPKEVLGKQRIILGEWHDGCYILLNDFKNIKIAYSFGIRTNIQFD